jgi:hypothetical protein
MNSRCDAYAEILQPAQATAPEKSPISTPSVISSSSRERDSPVSKAPRGNLARVNGGRPLW